MRINIHLTKNTELVPFNYQHKLVGALHKWLGANELHGNPALYSFSWLLNAKATDKGLDYPSGSRIFISFHDETYLKKVLKTILEDPKMCYGMSVADVSIEENPDLTNKTLFLCASPIFIKRFDGEKNIHYTFENKNVGKFLEETLLHKMALAGLAKDESLRIAFAPLQGKAKVKLIDYRGTKNKVSQCPIIIESKPETKVFAWNVGIGNSTGIGFGSLY